MDLIDWFGISTLASALTYMLFRFAVVKTVELNHVELWAQLGKPRVLERMRPGPFLSFVMLGRYKQEARLSAKEKFQFMALRMSILITILGGLAYLIGSVLPALSS